MQAVTQAAKYVVLGLGGLAALALLLAAASLVNIRSYWTKCRGVCPARHRSHHAPKAKAVH